MAGSTALSGTTMCGCLPHSVTGLLYFLTPHRVKKVDLVLMSALSQLVTVIPVIAKADTMTAAELITFRKEVRGRWLPHVTAASQSPRCLAMREGFRV